jgi:hypothetical protein
VAVARGAGGVAAGRSVAGTGAPRCSWRGGAFKKNSQRAALLSMREAVASAFTPPSLGRNSKIGLGNTVRRAPVDAVAQGASA